jgi:hypothetical protein
MPVSVLVYYRDADGRADELGRSLSRVRRRAEMLARGGEPPGPKLEACERRAEKLEELIGDADAEEIDSKMRAKFHKDMADLCRSCSAAIAPAGVSYDEPADAPGAVAWRPTSTRETVAGMMAGAGLREAPAADAARFEFDARQLDASGCNRIRQAVEAAARRLWEEAKHGQEAEDAVAGCVHADERKTNEREAVSRVFRAAATHYGAFRAAHGIFAGAVRAAGGTSAGCGRGWAARRAGGLHVGRDAEWMTPEAELVLWIREAMKWINREGPTGRNEIEAEIGARVANDPSRDAELFDSTVSAVVGAGTAAFDGETLSPVAGVGNKEERNAS